LLTGVVWHYTLHLQVPQGSVLDSLLFSLYTSPLANVVGLNGAMHRVFADDVNVYATVDPDDIDHCAALTTVSALCEWYVKNGMLPHSSKSEVLLVGTRHHLSKFPKVCQVHVAGVMVPCKNSIEFFRVTTDSGLKLNGRISIIITYRLTYV